MTSFDVAISRVIDAEKGLSNDRRDPGGLTKFGISKLAYPSVDIENLTREQAVEIYRRDYWTATRIGELPDRLAVAVFDTAVNSGTKFAATALQRSLQIQDDGVIGPKTLAAAHAADQSEVLMRFFGARLRMLSDLSTWPAFGRGWARRIADNLLEV